MPKLLLIVALLLAACGVDGPPVPPTATEVLP
jgi:predicted small lipoprotein YifL